MRTKGALIVTLIITAVFLVACASAPTPTHKADAVDLSFDQMHQEWKSKRQFVKPETRFKVDGWFIQAHNALVAWADSEIAGEADTTKKREFLDLKTKIILEVGKEMGWTQ